MEGYEVVTMRRPRRAPTSSSPPPATVDVIAIEHMRDMKDRAIVCNIGHFASEIQVAAPKKQKWHNIKPQVDEIEFPTKKAHHPSVRRTAGQSRQCHGSSEVSDVRLVAFVATRRSRRLNCGLNPGQVSEEGLQTAEDLDEKVARLHLESIGVHLTS